MAEEDVEKTRIASGLRILDEEIDALQGIRRHVGRDFSNAVALILSLEGRVATTGMGKAGIIAQMISATLASTGTLSIFLHPAEALHGDLGRVVHHATRAVHIAGITTNPDSNFMAQVARNLTMHSDGFLNGLRYLILDRDSKFSAQFRNTIEEAGVKIVRTGYQAPNMNAIAERWVLSVKSECLDRMIFFGEESLCRALREYCAHFNQERPHQGLGNKVISPPTTTDSPAAEIVETERLRGLLRSYYRVA